MSTSRVAVVLAFVLAFSFAAQAGEAEVEPGVLASKVVDVAVFKGGTGIFRFEGEGTVKGGQLVLKEAPKPAFGTLWFYSLDDGVKVVSVNSREIDVERERQITDMWELMRKNIGKTARVVMKDGEKSPEHGVPSDWEITGKIVSVSGDKQVLLESEEGLVACAVQEMRYAVVTGAETIEKTKGKKLDICVAVEGAAEGQKVRLGYSCLQSGISWLPAYRMDLASGKANLSLAASVINNVFDIAKSRASFVVGQPLFTLAEQLAPIAQRNAEIDLKEFARQEGANYFYWDEKADLDKMIASNTAQFDSLQRKGWAGGSYVTLAETGYGAAGVRGSTAGLPVAGRMFATAPPAPQEAVAGEAAEAWHLFYYTADDVTVAKDTSASVVLWTSENPVENLFVWNAPLPRAYQNPEYAKRLREIYTGGLFRASTVDDKSSDPVKYDESRPPVHCLKMTNETSESWASAPLLVYEDGRALGQVWLQYTPAGRDTQVVIGPTSDVRTWKALREVRREIGAHEQDKVKFDLVTYEGFFKIENKRDEKAALQVKTSFAGTPVSYDKGAEVTTERDAGTGLNPATTIEWKVDVEAGKEKVLTFKYTLYMRH